ncbi:hypothetical protein chiPu_0016744 [Chiloscyllium punctatum]|uniref:Uncharacterized protein n=1 Tax=Chiloscyllium punctatum TaxID=137246 RepID=A0A401T6I5_CHIPU|nr:hypothetical protein [Chiloscyllium punctatum]
MRSIGTAVPGGWGGQTEPPRRCPRVRFFSAFTGKALVVGGFRKRTGKTPSAQRKPPPDCWLRRHMSVTSLPSLGAGD